jgi:hypothetical protein
MDCWWNDADGKTKVLGKNTVPVPLSPLVWHGTQAPVVRDWQLSNTMAQLNTVYKTGVCARAQLSVRFSHLLRRFQVLDCNSMST